MTAAVADVLARLASPQAARDPYPVLAWLREKEPVHRTRAGFYLISRHADVLALLSGNALRAPDLLPAADGHASLAMRLDTMLLKDGIEHARLRRLVSRDFTPRRVHGLLARMAHICEGLLDTVEVPLRDGEDINLHQALSVPFTLQVFSELLGVPEPDRPELADCVLDIVTAFGSGRPEQLATADRRTEHLTAYFRGLAATRRAEPRDDLVSALVRTHGDDPDRLAGPELLATLWALWIVGFETTAAALDHAVRALLAHPDLPLDEAFVAEVLRWSGPALFSSIPRIAIRDLQLEGGTLPAGADVRVAFAAANRDPRAFPEPDRFDPGRSGGTALALGHGVHYCLGAFLAQAELAVALPRVRDRFPGLTAAAEPEWNSAVIMHAPTSLPVRVRKTRHERADPLSERPARPRGASQLGWCGRSPSGWKSTAIRGANGCPVPAVQPTWRHYPPRERMGSVPSQFAAASWTSLNMPSVSGLYSMSSMIAAGPAGGAR